MREWFADKAIMLGSIAIAAGAVAFSLAPVFV